MEELIPVACAIFSALFVASFLSDITKNDTYILKDDNGTEVRITIQRSENDNRSVQEIVKTHLELGNFKKQ